MSETATEYLIIADSDEESKVQELSTTKQSIPTANECSDLICWGKVSYVEGIQEVDQNTCQISTLSCNYDTVKPIRSKRHDLEGHDLDETDENRFLRCFCDICGSRGSKYYCKKCNWDICFKCFQSEIDKSSVFSNCIFFGSSVIKSKKHKCELKLSPKSRKRYAYCDKCSRSGTEYFCKKHDWDICKKCFDAEMKSDGSCSFLKLPRLCGGSAANFVEPENNEDDNGENEEDENYDEEEYEEEDDEAYEEDEEYDEDDDDDDDDDDEAEVYDQEDDEDPFGISFMNDDNLPR